MCMYQLLMSKYYDIISASLLSCRGALYQNLTHGQWLFHLNHKNHLHLALYVVNLHCKKCITNHVDLLTSKWCIAIDNMKSYEVISEQKGNIEKNLSTEYGFPSGTRLMGILRIHLKIYSPECNQCFKQSIYTIFSFIFQELESCPGIPKKTHIFMTRMLCKY